MSGLQAFSSHISLMVTLVSFLILIFAGIYTARASKYRKGIYYLLIGFSLDIAGSWLGSSIPTLTNLSVNFLVFLELVIMLVSMIFLALAASQFIASYMPDAIIAIAVSLVGMIAIIYFVFVNPDGEMVNNMLYIFPIAGLAYISASFWTQSSRHRPGFIFGGLITGIVTLFSVLMLFRITFFIENSSYMPALLYIALTLTLFMLKNDYMAQELKESTEKIKGYNRKIEEIIKLSPFPILISRLSDDKIMLANNNAVKLFSIPYDEVDHFRLRDFFAEPEARQALSERLEREKEVQDFELLVKTPTSETPFWLLASANVIDYNFDIAIYMAFQDITIRKTKENLLKNQAIRDPLTSLYNRRYFEEEVGKRISEAKIDNSDYSVLMVDADHFKRVNDTYGHKIGDKVLIELASTCEKALRENDIVARYGGEEFVIFLSKTDAPNAKMVSDRLRESIAQIVVHADDGSPVTFTVSIGISSSAVSDNIDHLIKTADEALYRAKANGRNRSEIFTPQDMDSFKSEETIKEEKLNRHPIFDKENEQEISLLDGVETGHLTDK